MCKEPNYQKMYLTMFHANEEAVKLLIAAQQECEELYISAAEPDGLSEDKV